MEPEESARLMPPNFAPAGPNEDVVYGACRPGYPVRGLESFCLYQLLLSQLLLGIIVLLVNKLGTCIYLHPILQSQL